MSVCVRGSEDQLTDEAEIARSSSDRSLEEEIRTDGTDGRTGPGCVRLSSSNRLSERERACLSAFALRARVHVESARLYFVGPSDVFFLLVWPFVPSSVDDDGVSLRLHARIGPASLYSLFLIRPRGRAGEGGRTDGSRMDARQHARASRTFALSVTATAPLAQSTARRRRRRRRRRPLKNEERRKKAE